MCGIVGILGRGPVAGDILAALKRLEYRGYDSAGIATLENGRLTRLRAEGKLKNLEARLAAAPLEGAIGIGHTRWATHGKPTEAQRPSARQPASRRRPQRHHREFPGVARGADRQGPSLRHRDRFGSRGVSGRRRNGDGQEPGRGGRGGAEAPARRLRAGLSLRRRGRSADRRAAGRAARRRLRRGRDVSRLGRAGAGALHRPRRLSRRGRLGRRDAPRAPSSTTPRTKSSSAASCAARRADCWRKRAIIATSWPRKSTSSRKSSATPSPITSTWARSVCAPSPGPSTPRRCRAFRSSAAAPPIWPASSANIGSSVSPACRSRSTSPPNIAIARRRVEKGGLTIFISQSGETADTLAALRYAKEQGGKTVAVVNVADLQHRAARPTSPRRPWPARRSASPRPRPSPASSRRWRAWRSGSRARAARSAKSEEAALVGELIATPGLLAEALKLEPLARADRPQARARPRRALSRPRHRLSASRSRARSSSRSSATSTPRATRPAN